ncbi:MAG: hypothetical protein SPF56_04365 [Bacteroidaceae bacterium]|nr:hypothetical protein [Bacteroidaceae bacterium]
MLTNVRKRRGADSAWLKSVIEEFHHPNINMRQGKKGDEFSLTYQCQQYAENHPMAAETIKASQYVPTKRKGYGL